MAAPHVASVAALIKAKPAAHAGHEVKIFLKQPPSLLVQHV